MPLAEHYCIAQACLHSREQIEEPDYPPDTFSLHVRSLQECPVALKYVCIRIHHVGAGVRIRTISCAVPVLTFS